MASQAFLQLLHGPTKALVASCLAAGAAADLALASRNPALCFVARPAYDDDAFLSLYGSPRERALATSKPKRSVGYRALAELTAPSYVAFTVGRNVGLALLLTVNKWMLAALEEEEAAEAEEREAHVEMLKVEEVVASCQRGCYNACIELTVHATRAGLDAQAVQHLPPKIAKKLIKDLRQSAVRKGRLPWFTRVPRMARTAAFSEATWWAADFLVSCALEAHAQLLKASGSRQTRLRRWALRCSLHAARVVVVLAAVSLGSSVGSASPHKRGFAMWICSMVASYAANGRMLALLNHVAPLGAAAGIDAGTGSVAKGVEPPPAAGNGTGPNEQLQQQQQQRGPAPGGRIVLVGQAVHPAAAAAAGVATMAAAAAVGEQQLANGPAELAAAGAAQIGAEEVVEEEQPAVAEEILEQQAVAEDEAPAENAAVAGEAAVAEEVPAAEVQEAGVQAGGGADAAEPPIPAPQQRRVVGGPRLPERGGRRHAAAGSDEPRMPAAAAMPQGMFAPPPAAPATPQFRTDQRAPTPAGDSEDVEARLAGAAGPSPLGSTPGAGSGRQEASDVSPSTAGSSQGSSS